MIEEKLCKKIVSHPSVPASYGLAGLHSWPGTHRDNSNHIAFHEMIIRQPLSSKKWTLLHASVCYTYSLARCFALLLLMLLLMLHNGPSTQNTSKSQCIKSNILGTIYLSYFNAPTYTSIKYEVVNKFANKTKRKLI